MVKDENVCLGVDINVIINVINVFDLIVNAIVGIKLVSKVIVNEINGHYDFIVHVAIIIN